MRAASTDAVPHSYVRYDYSYCKCRATHACVTRLSGALRYARGQLTQRCIQMRVASTGTVVRWRTVFAQIFFFFGFIYSDALASQGSRHQS